MPSWFPFKPMSKREIEVDDALLTSIREREVGKTVLHYSSPKIHLGLSGGCPHTANAHRSF